MTTSVYINRLYWTLLKISFVRIFYYLLTQPFETKETTIFSLLHTARTPFLLLNLLYQHRVAVFSVYHKEYYRQDFRNNPILRVHASGKKFSKWSEMQQKQKRVEYSKCWNSIAPQAIFWNFPSQNLFLYFGIIGFGWGIQRIWATARGFRKFVLFSTGFLISITLFHRGDCFSTGAQFLPIFGNFSHRGFHRGWFDRGTETGVF